MFRSFRDAILPAAFALGSGLACGLGSGCAAPRATPLPVQLEGPLPALVGFTNPAAWTRRQVSPTVLELLSPEVRTGAPWRELVVSWNVEPAARSALTVEAQGVEAHRATRFYRLGDWSLGEDAPLPRTSHRDEPDADGEVRTDTLVLRSPAPAVRIRLTLHGRLARDPHQLRLLTLAFSDPAHPPPPREPLREVWGTSLAVPERSQVAYPGGEGWCSPTSVSMILAWWAQQLHRPDLDRDVPQVAAGVHDPAWPGTGNWPFNMAYAGSFAGLRACAARLRDLRAVEELVAAGIPVALSASAPMLRGQNPVRNGGHLVIAVGFTAAGDLVANDPWARLEEGQRVRRVYRRPDVERAWEHAHRLAYLVAPAPQASVFPAEWR